MGTDFEKLHVLIMARVFDLLHYAGRATSSSLDLVVVPPSQFALLFVAPQFALLFVAYCILAGLAVWNPFTS